jgi:tocopherol cyclase
LAGFVRRTLHPAWYHGHGKSPPFFEGWYYKLVDASEAFRYSVIPGVFLSDDPARRHAFVQVLDGVSGQATYHVYPAKAFRAARDRFEIWVGPSRFSGESMSLQIASPERTIHGQVRLEGLNPWPVTLASPGIMGWYGWLPFMECYHGVVSLDHALRGSLTVDGRAIDWTGGRGYVEKDWGSAFPEAWVWFQSNHFGQPGTSLTASLAIIPWLGSAFRGHIVGLWHGGQLYRFATYTGAQIERLELDDSEVRCVVRDRKHRLEMRALRAQGGLIRGPNRIDMGVRVPETLNATVEVRLSRLGRVGQAPIWEGRGRYAGLEAVGDLERLLSL